jgi:hypothetical protein
MNRRQPAFVAGFCYARMSVYFSHFHAYFIMQAGGLIPDPAALFMVSDMAALFRRPPSGSIPHSEGKAEHITEDVYIVILSGSDPIIKIFQLRYTHIYGGLSPPVSTEPAPRFFDVSFDVTFCHA